MSDQKKPIVIRHALGEENLRYLKVDGTDPIRAAEALVNYSEAVASNDQVTLTALVEWSPGTPEEIRQEIASLLSEAEW